MSSSTDSSDFEDDEAMLYEPGMLQRRSVMRKWIQPGSSVVLVFSAVGLMAAICAINRMHQPAPGTIPVVEHIAMAEEEKIMEGDFSTNAEDTKYFTFGNQVRTVYEALYAAWTENGVKSQKPMGFTESNAPERTWNEVAAWVDKELLNGPNPFAKHGNKVPIPWPQGGNGEDQLNPGQWVTYSRRQVCYIVAKSLMGAPTPGYNNGLKRYMEQSGSLPFQGCLPRKSDFGKAWWRLLAACSADPGLANGGQGPVLLATKAKPKPSVFTVREASKRVMMSSAGLRVCRYDDGSNGDMPGSLTPVPKAGCSQPSAKGPGNDFMAGGLPKQATQDISARFLGGYIFGNACGLGGGQDERLMIYFPEVSALAFFLSQAPGIANNQNPPQLRQPAWILGARKIMYGLDGTARFDNYESFDQNIPLTSDLASIKLGGKRFNMSSSRPFLGFMSENQDFIPWDDAAGTRKARRNKDGRQRTMDPSKPDAFGKQVRAWYGAVALTSWNEEIQPILKAVVGSIGVGPWLSGLWWGDSQLGLLAVWIGHAIAAGTWDRQSKFPVDYYMYSSFTENPGNQCFVHSKDNCVKCLKHCHNKPLPASSYWLPKGVQDSPSDPCVSGNAGADCGKIGIEDIVGHYESRNADLLWGEVEARVGKNQWDVSKSAFDELMMVDAYRI